MPSKAFIFLTIHYVNNVITLLQQALPFLIKIIMNYTNTQAPAPAPAFAQGCFVKKHLLRNYNTVDLYKIGWSELNNYTNFVFNIYKQSYTDQQQWKLSEDDHQHMRHEDHTYFPHSTYFAFIDPHQQIVGTIKTTQKTKLVLLPAEIEYGIDLDHLCQQMNTSLHSIWHTGRLAVNKHTLKILGISSRKMFMELLYKVFQHITQYPGGFFLAEADKRVVHLFHQVGINLQQIAQGKMYLGSESYPVIITHEDMLTWLSYHSSSIDLAY